jgi:hypothetical protein
MASSDNYEYHGLMAAFWDPVRAYRHWADRAVPGMDRRERQPVLDAGCNRRLLDYLAMIDIDGVTPPETDLRGRPPAGVLHHPNFRDGCARPAPKLPYDPGPPAVPAAGRPCRCPGCAAPLTSTWSRVGLLVLPFTPICARKV